MERKIMNMTFSSIKLVSTKLLATITLLMFVTIVQATTYYSLSGATDPSTLASWTINSDGSAGTVPSNFITLGDIFIIRSGQTMTPGGNWTMWKSATAYSSLVVNGTLASSSKTLVLGPLTINSGGTAYTGTSSLKINGATTISGTLNVNMASNGSLVFNGLVTVNSGGTYTESTAVKPTYYGGITNLGTFTASTGVHLFTTNAQTITGTVTIPSVKLNAMTLTNNGNFTITTALAKGGSTYIVQGTNSTLTFGFSENGLSLTGLTATATGNTVVYNASATQTVWPTSYYNLTLGGTSAKTTTSVKNFYNNTLCNV